MILNLFLMFSRVATLFLLNNIAIKVINDIICVTAFVQKCAPNISPYTPSENSKNAVDHNALWVVQCGLS